MHIHKFPKPPPAAPGGGEDRIRRPPARRCLRIRRPSDCQSRASTLWEGHRHTVKPFVALRAWPCGPVLTATGPCPVRFLGRSRFVMRLWALPGGRVAFWALSTASASAFADGRVYVAGRNDWGQLGLNTIGHSAGDDYRMKPLDVGPFAADVEHIAFGSRHTLIMAGVVGDGGCGRITTPPPRALVHNSAPLGAGGGGDPTPPTQHPPKDWAKFSSGPSADQKFSLAPLAPISSDQKFSSAPLKISTTGGGGGGGLRQKTPAPTSSTPSTPATGPR